MTTPIGDFNVFQEHPTLKEGMLGFHLWKFTLSREPLPDLPFNPRDVARKNFNAGFTRCRGVDRHKYDTIVAMLQHEDTGHHDYLDAVRLVWQKYGFDEAGQAGGGRLISRNMEQLTPQGMNAYPYEVLAALPVNLDMPGAKIDLFHRRIVDGTPPQVFQQHLTRIEIPAVDPANPSMEWYYQRHGWVVGVHADLGVVAQIIVSGMHPAYSFKEARVATVF